MVYRITLPPQYNPALFPTGKGITITGQTVEFKDYTKEVADNIVGRFWKKDLGDSTNATLKTAKKTKSLSDDEVAEIKKYLPDGYDPKKHTIYKMGAANTKLDFDYDQFTPAYLQAMAKAVNENGASFLFNHLNDHVVGKVFYATTGQMDGADAMHTELVEYAMVMNSATLPGQPGNSIVDNIDSGALDHVSVRFGRWKSEIKEVGGKYIRIIDTPEDGEVLHPETSAVFFHAQRGATIKLISSDREGKKFDEFDIKIFNPQVITEKSFKMAKVEQEYKFGDKVVKTITEVEGDTGKTSGAAELQTEINSALAERNAAQKELADAKLPLVNKVLNLEGKDGLNLSAPRKEADLKNLSLAELQNIEKDVIAALKKAHPMNQLIANSPANEKEVETEAKQFAWEK